CCGVARRDAACDRWNLQHAAVVAEYIIAGERNLIEIRNAARVERRLRIDFATRRLRQRELRRLDRIRAGDRLRDARIDFEVNVWPAARVASRKYCRERHFPGAVRDLHAAQEVLAR